MEIKTLTSHLVLADPNSDDLFDPLSDQVRQVRNQDDDPENCFARNFDRQILYLSAMLLTQREHLFIHSLQIKIIKEGWFGIKTGRST